MIEKIILIVFVLLSACVFSQYCLAAEVRDGVTYYGNENLPPEKTRVPSNQPLSSTTGPANIPTASDEIVREVNNVLCNSNDTRQDPDLFSDADIQARLNRLEWLKSTSLISETNISKKMIATNIIDSCSKIWKITLSTKTSRRTTEELLRKVQDKANKGR